MKTLEQSAQQIADLLFWSEQYTQAFTDLCKHAFDFTSDEFGRAQARFNLAKFRLSQATKISGDETPITLEQTNEETGEC